MTRPQWCCRVGALLAGLALLLILPNAALRAEPPSLTAPPAAAATIKPRIDPSKLLVGPRNATTAPSVLTNPTGFILTVVLGVAGAFLATFIGQTIGWYRLDQGAGFIAATVGALVVLFIWNRLVARNVISDPGTPAGPRRWL